MIISEFNKETILLLNDKDKTLAFQKANLDFVFNLHNEMSYVDYSIPVKSDQIHELILCSDNDDKQFGGHGRVAPKQKYWVTRNSADQQSDFDFDLTQG